MPITSGAFDFHRTRVPLDGCPMFAPAYMGRKRRGEAPSAVCPFLYQQEEIRGVPTGQPAVFRAHHGTLLDSGSSPEGTSELSPGRQSWDRYETCEKSREGRLNTADRVSAVPHGTDPAFSGTPGLRPGLSSDVPSGLNLEQILVPSPPHTSAPFRER